jgi:biotin-dependent carboxylase-like uncharacterized protein
VTPVARDVDDPAVREVLEVLEPGALSTVQGPPRAAAAWGVPPGGPLDAGAAAAALALARCGPDDALLELALAGPRLRALRDVVVAVAGADLGGEILPSRRPAAPGRTHRLAAGEILDLTRGATDPTATRTYLAIPGGFDVPVVLGSRATCLPGAFGGLDGRPLRSGDRLRASDPAVAGGAPPARWAGPVPQDPPASPIRILPGPAGLGPGDPVVLAAALAATRWRVASDSDRRGLRLAAIGAAPPPLHGTGDLPSYGTVPGTIQVPPDGAPVVLLADGGTTGGYPVAAVVLAADLDRVGQLGPGAEVAFRLVDGATARTVTAREPGRAEPLADHDTGDQWDDLWRSARG